MVYVINDNYYHCPVFISTIIMIIITITSNTSCDRVLVVVLLVPLHDRGLNSG
jgi:hypothetical protein